MSSNLDRFKADLSKLVALGHSLEIAMRLACFPEQIEASLRKQLKSKTAEYIKQLPDFGKTYQRW